MRVQRFIYSNYARRWGGNTNDCSIFQMIFVHVLDALNNWNFNYLDIFTEPIESSLHFWHCAFLRFFS